MADILTFHPDRSDIATHPARAAWLTAGGTSVEGIEVLLNENGLPWHKSSIFRLILREPSESVASVIAKKGRPDRIRLEQRLYESVLPQIPVTKLRYLGHAQDPDLDRAWIFVEDAGDEPFLDGSADHRKIASEWVGALHTTAAGMPAVRSLPHEGTEDHLAMLRAARTYLLRFPTGPEMSEGTAGTVHSLVDTLSELEDRWSLVEDSCDRAPRTLVHGDLTSKNLRVRSQEGSQALFALDWETASFSFPATDLSIVEPAHYLAQVGRIWPTLTLDDVERLALVGRIFLTVGFLEATAKGLDRSWIDAATWDLAYYEEELSREVAALVGSRGA